MMASYSKRTQRDQFDMWHDYLNLGRQLEALCEAAGVERRRGAEGSEERRPDTPRERTSSVGGPWNSETPLPNYCRFCKRNGESDRVFRSHRLKTEDGRITCPILWHFTCPICGATGDRAHTPRHCPTARRHAQVLRRLELAETLTGSRLWTMEMMASDDDDERLKTVNNS